MKSQKKAAVCRIHHNLAPVQLQLSEPAQGVCLRMANQKASNSTCVWTPGLRIRSLGFQLEEKELARMPRGFFLGLRLAVHKLLLKRHIPVGNFLGSAGA